jgi:Na+-transporting methylmalonyl-CoA/oxaloacetate decarboxylase gamma subunit
MDFLLKNNSAMKRKLVLSFLFVFTLALSAPVMSNAMIQEPEKKECEKKEPCSKEAKAECDKKKDEKKECEKTEEKTESDTEQK